VATLKYAWDQYNLKTKLGSQHLKYEIAVKPTDLNTSEQVLSAKHAGNFEPSTETYETTNGFKYGSPAVGPVKFWTTVSRMQYSNSVCVFGRKVIINAADIFN
jgi:hypothetical protein